MAKQISVFSLIPEDCIAKVISLTTPKDVCRLAAVSIGLKYTAESDTIWESFLPPDYRNTLARCTSPVIYYSKKELYFLLCDDPVLLDGGKMSFWLSKRTGRKCYMLCARKLHIAWQDTPMYWKWTSLAESRFSEVAELINVCWLDIIGVIQAQMLSPDTTYIAYLVYKLTEDHYGTVCLSKATVKFLEGSSSTLEIEGTTTSNFVYIEPPPIYEQIMRDRLNRVRLTCPANRTDGWKEIELGTFFNGSVHNNIDIHMQLSETIQLRWKKGLIVEGIEVRPKEGL